MDVTIRENDVLTAITGIANGILSDGVDDGTGTVHPISVVIWRIMGLPDHYSVIVHLDHISVAPYEDILTKLDVTDLSAAAVEVAGIALRKADRVLDARQDAEAIEAATGKDRVELAAIAAAPRFPLESVVSIWIGVQHYTGKIVSVGPVVATVKTDDGLALVTVDELEAWNA
jgi:hypothetical protein